MIMTNVLQDKSYLSVEQQDLGMSDIMDAKRFLYLYFDANDIEAYQQKREDKTTVKIGKAIQINLSVAKAGAENIEIIPWVRGSGNSNYITMNMYVYDTRFMGSIENFYDAEFTLINAAAGSTTNDFDIHKAFTNGARMYSRDIRDDPAKKQLIKSITQVTAPTIPDPIYYTMQQQENCINEIYCITALTDVIWHRGYELIDDYTTISIMDIRKMDTFNMQIRDKMREIHSLCNEKDINGNSKINMFDNAEIASYMMWQDFLSMQHGYMYIYDSQLGKNIVPTKNAYMAFGNSKKGFRMKESMVEDLENTIQMLEDFSKNVESKFGSINLMYIPGFYGNKIHVNFKDYNPENQPNIKVGSGGVNIDNGTRLQDQFTENFGKFYKNEQNQWCLDWD